MLMHCDVFPRFSVIIALLHMVLKLNFVDQNCVPVFYSIMIMRSNYILNKSENATTELFAIYIQNDVSQ